MHQKYKQYTSDVMEENACAFGVSNCKKYYNEGLCLG
jgi:hypothetical protein